MQNLYLHVYKSKFDIQKSRYAKTTSQTQSPNKMFTLLVQEIIKNKILSLY